jgi:hypothetical protein
MERVGTPTDLEDEWGGTRSQPAIPPVSGPAAIGSLGRSIRHRMGRPT